MKYFHLLVSALITTLLTFAMAASAVADNGEVAIARPMESIVVDGNSDDWPDSTVAFPMNRSWNKDVEVSSRDFSSTFKSGFNVQEKEIYFLVEVIDDSHVDERELTDDQAEHAWQFNDACIFYLDTQHSPKGSGPQVFVNFGSEREVLGKENAWDPVTTTASWDNVELAVARKDKLTTYEWKFKNCANVKVGKTIGLDFLMCDSDQEDAANGSIHLWGPEAGKSGGGGRLGDLILLPADSKLFDVAGKIAWKESSASAESNDDSGEAGASTKQAYPERVQLISDSTSILIATVAVDKSGAFKARLPKGKYRVSLVNQIAEDVSDEKSRRIRFVDAPLISVGHEKEGTVTTFELDFESRPNFHSPTSPLFSYSKEHDSDLIKVIDNYQDYFDVPGYSMALIRDGELVFHRAAGQSNHFTGKPVDERTLFEAASVTKVVFAFAVNRLAEKGEIDLDKPLSETLEFVEMSDPRVKKVTARHCLNHSSGLPNWFNLGEKMLFEPGEKFGYSGAAMEYLGRVVAHTQNKPLEEVVLDEVCRPLGFTESVFFSDCEELRAVASFGHLNKMPQAHDNHTDIGVASSMFAESKAFSKFMIALMNRKVLSPETYEQMFKLSMPSESDDQEEYSQGFGLGFQVEESKHGKIIKHGGNNGDFQCLFEIYDKSNDGFVIFTNADTGGDFIAAVRDYLLNGVVGDIKSKAKALTTEEQPRENSSPEIGK